MQTCWLIFPCLPSLFVQIDFKKELNVVFFTFIQEMGLKYDCEYCCYFLNFGWRFVCSNEWAHVTNIQTCIRWAALSCSPKWNVNDLFPKAVATILHTIVWCCVSIVVCWNFLSEHNASCCLNSLFFHMEFFHMDSYANCFAVKLIYYVLYTCSVMLCIRITHFIAKLKDSFLSISLRVKIIFPKSECEHMPE